jgi:anti-sigma factor RsiW
LNEHDIDLVGPYVLDALPPDEVEAFEVHLQGCETCRAEVAELYQVIGVLPLAVESVAPPPALRDRLMAAIAAVEGETAPAAEAVTPPTLTAVPGGASEPRRRVRQFSVVPTLVAVAAALLIAGLGIQNLRLQQRIDDQNKAVAAAALQQQVTVALANGAVPSHIPGTKAAPAASATLVQPVHGNTAYFIVKGLKASPSNRIYQLWLVKTSQKGLLPHSAGIFTYGGSGATIVKLPISSKGYPLAAVTLEQCPNGCAAPHGVMYLLGKISA